MTDFPNWEDRKILIADDAIENFRIYEFYLSKTNIKIEFAANGVEAIEKSLAGDFDLFLLDIEMPLMNGYEAMIELKSKRSSRKVIAMTAYDLDLTQLEDTNSKFDGHIVKPIDRETLVGALKAFLQ